MKPVVDFWWSIIRIHKVLRGLICFDCFKYISPFTYENPDDAAAAIND